MPPPHPSPLPRDMVWICLHNDAQRPEQLGQDRHDPSTPLQRTIKCLVSMRSRRCAHSARVHKRPKPSFESLELKVKGLHIVNYCRMLLSPPSKAPKGNITTSFSADVSVATFTGTEMTRSRQPQLLHAGTKGIFGKVDWARNSFDPVFHARRHLHGTSRRLSNDSLPSLSSTPPDVSFEPFVPASTACNSLLIFASWACWGVEGV